MHTVAATRAFVPLLSSEAMLSASPADAELFTHRPFGDAFAAIATTRRAQALVADIAAAPQQSISYAEAVTKHGALVHSIVKSIGRRHEAEDLAQDGFEALMTAARNYREDGGASFATYAYYCVRLACLRALHVARRRGLTPSHDYQQGKRPREISSVDAVDDDGVSLLDVLGVEATQENAIDASRRRDALQRASEKLSAHDRRVFDLMAAGLDAAEIGERLATSPRNVAKHIRLLCARLRLALGLPAEAGGVRRAVQLTYGGRTASLYAWANELGVAYIVLYSRAVLKGWTAARTLETPVAKRQGGRPSKATSSASG